VLITGLTADPTEAFGTEQVIELRVSAAQARAVQAFIARTMGALTPYTTGPYQGSLYFAALPRYSALHTCNTWAAEALQAGELPVRSAAVVFAGQLWGQVRKVAAAKPRNAPHSSSPVGLRPGGVPAPTN
jgi:hypothetical protein